MSTWIDYTFDCFVPKEHVKEATDLAKLLYFQICSDSDKNREEPAPEAVFKWWGFTMTEGDNGDLHFHEYPNQRMWIDDVLLWALAPSIRGELHFESEGGARATWQFRDGKVYCSAAELVYGDFQQITKTDFSAEQVPYLETAQAFYKKEK